MSNYPYEYMPAWYVPFNYSYKDGAYKWNSFPKLGNQTVWSDEISGGWQGSILYTVDNCVSHAITTLMQINQYLANGNKIPFSIDWIYGNRKNTDWQNEGLYITEALDNILVDGVLTYAYLPEQHGYNIVAPDGKTAKSIVNNVKPSLIDKARINRIGSYQITSPTVNIEYLKQCITRYGGVLLDTGINYAWDNPPDGIIEDVMQEYSGSVASSAIPGNVSAYHTVVAMGWKYINQKLYWICWNNWGYWGDTTGLGAGICYIPADYILIRNFYILTPYFKSKPTSFSWLTNIIKGGSVYQTVKITDISYIAYIVTALEWNSFTNKINEFLLYKGLSTYEFTQVVRGTDLAPVIVNQVINNINRMLPIGNKITYTDTITAQLFLDMRNKLNSIT